MSNGNNSNKIGSIGEQKAAEFLIANGYKIKEMNFHYSRRAEIDLIAKEWGTLVFVEIKNYKKKSLANVYQAITYSKKRKIILAAKGYLAKNYKGQQCPPARFDVVFLEDSEVKHHIKGAFFIS